MSEWKQLELKLRTKEELRSAVRHHMAHLRLPERQRAVIEVLVVDGVLAPGIPQRLKVLCISERDACRAAQTTKTSWRNGVADLVHGANRGLLEVSHVTRPASYTFSLDRFAQLQPIAEIDYANLPIVSGTWSPNMRLDADIAAFLLEPMPWRRQGPFTDAILRTSVLSGDLRGLSYLYEEACSKGWIIDSEDAQLRFLTIAHHCATSTGLASRVAVMRSLVHAKKGCMDVRGCRHASEDWARLQRLTSSATPPMMC